MTHRDRKIGSVVTVGAVVLLVSSYALATNINTHGNICISEQPEFSQYISYTTGQGVTNTNSGSLYVMCSVPRSPLAAGADGGFYIDGSNGPGVSTNCAMESWDYTGTFLAQHLYNSSAATYDGWVPFAAAELPYYSYVELQCFLPGNSAGILRGVTSVQ
jgi:hypothetical protein